MQKPVIVFTLAYIAGLLLGHFFLYVPYSIIALVITVLVLSIILGWRGIFSFRRLLLVALPAAAGMAAYLYSAAWLPANHYTSFISEDKTVHVVTGRIVSPLDRDPDRTGFVVDISEIDSVTATGRLRVSIREVLTSIGYDDVVRISGKLFPPRGYQNPGGFDYETYLARRGIHHTLVVKNSDHIRLIVRGSGILRTIQDWRERIRQTFLNSTRGPGSAILQAMTLGEEGGLTDEIRDRFLTAGVTHIISISGSQKL